MATLNVPIIDGNGVPFVTRGEDLGAGSADNTAGKVVALHRHDAIFYAAWETQTGYGLTKNYATGTDNTTGDHTIVAAAGSGNIISVAYLMLANESATDNTVIIKSGSTERARVRVPANDTKIIQFPHNFPLETTTNTALVINLSSANAIGWSVGYYVKS